MNNRERAQVRLQYVNYKDVLLKESQIGRAWKSLCSPLFVPAGLRIRQRLTDSRLLSYYSAILNY